MAMTDCVTVIQNFTLVCIYFSFFVYRFSIARSVRFSTVVTQVSFGIGRWFSCGLFPRMFSFTGSCNKIIYSDICVMCTCNLVNVLGFLVWAL